MPEYKPRLLEELAEQIKDKLEVETAEDRALETHRKRVKRRKKWVSLTPLQQEAEEARLAKEEEERQAKATKNFLSRSAGKKTQAERKRIEARAEFIESLQYGGSRHQLFMQGRRAKTRVDRIRFVVDLITTGNWRSYAVPILSDMWEITQSSTIDVVRAAQAAVQATNGGRAELSTTVLGWLEQIVDAAMEKGELRTAVAAIAEFSKTAGLNVNRTEITGADGGPVTQVQVLRTMSDDELARKALEMVREQIAAGALSADEAKKLLGPVPDAEFEVLETTVPEDEEK